MSDMYHAWDQEDAQEQDSPSVRRDRLSDAIERFLREKLAPEDTEIFTLAQARALFDKMLSARPISEQMEDKCALQVEREAGKYRIKLILLDKNNNCVQATTKSYYGYVFLARHVDETVVRYMGDQKLRIMPNPNS